MFDTAGDVPAAGDGEGSAHAPAPGGSGPAPAAPLTTGELDTVLIVRPLRDDEGRLVDGVIEFANEAWLTIFAPPGVDPVGRRILELDAGGPGDPRWRAFQEAADAGRSMQFLLPHPVHQDRIGELRVVPIDGRVLFTSHDATAAERAHTALAASEARYRELVEQAFDGILVIGPDGRLSGANRRAAELLGVAPDDLPALETMQRAAVMHASDSERATHRERLLAGEIVTGDATVTRPDGTRVRVEQRARMRDDGSTVTVLRDVTAIRAAEEAAHERLVQEARAEAVGQLAGGVAHDLNNHLTAVLGYAALGLETLDSPQELARDLRRIVQAAEQAQEVTRRLLAFGRRTILRPRDVDLGEVLAGVEPALRHVAGNRMALIVGPAPGLPRVRVDPLMLERALIALVENARDAMEGRGVLGITTGIADAAHAAHAADAAHAANDLPDGPWGYVRIEDSGIGMDAETLAHAFDPFFGARPGGPVGLGLPMVQGFLDQSGGHLRVASAPGAGTVVTMYLPLPDAAEPAAPAPVIPVDATRAPVVVVVDDEPLLRAIAERVLRRAGYTVVVAASGEEAMLAIRESGGEVDLLFADVVMPGMNGIALANLLRRQHPGVRVLLTSGYGRDEVDRQALSGAAAFLPKPYTPAAMLETVRQVLGAPVSD